MIILLIGLGFFVLLGISLLLMNFAGSFEDGGAGWFLGMIAFSSYWTGIVFTALGILIIIIKWLMEGGNLL